MDGSFDIYYSKKILNAYEFASFLNITNIEFTDNIKKLI